MKIGIQVSSVKKYLQTPEQVMESFAKIAGMTDTVQVQWVGEAVPDETVAEALRVNGLDCVSTQDYYEKYMPDMERVIAQNLLWGSRDICVSGIPKDRRSAAGCEAMLREMEPLAKRLGSLGLTLSFHARTGEYDIFDGVSGFERIVDAHPEFKICLDLCHTVKAGQDTVAMLKKYQGRIDIVHFKDYVMDGGVQRLVPVGQGCVDWLPIIKACVETGVKYALVEQESWEKDAFECLSEGAQYLAAACGSLVG